MPLASPPAPAWPTPTALTLTTEDTTEFPTLGVSADEVIGAFLGTGQFPFDVEVRPFTVDGKVRQLSNHVGKYHSGNVELASLRLYGPDADIESAHLVMSYLSAEQNPALQDEFDEFVDIFIQATASRHWPGAGQWVAQSIRHVMTGQERVRDDRDDGLAISVRKFEKSGTLVVNVSGSTR